MYPEEGATLRKDRRPPSGINEHESRPYLQPAHHPFVRNRAIGTDRPDAQTRFPGTEVLTPIIRREGAGEEDLATVRGPAEGGPKPLRCAPACHPPPDRPA